MLTHSAERRDSARVQRIMKTSTLHLSRQHDRGRNWARRLSFLSVVNHALHARATRGKDSRIWKLQVVPGAFTFCEQQLENFEDNRHNDGQEKGKQMKSQLLSEEGSREQLVLPFWLSPSRRRRPSL
jgi:uncharacterized membrane protein YccC